MPSGDCFRCKKPGHWANQCPLKTPTKTTTTLLSPLPVDAASPPVFYCPSDGATCLVLTSTTVKNPNRKFYKCPSSPSCNFFKWCDEVIVKFEPLSVNPTCPCGSGPCRKVTVTDGSYFVCCIKKGFGACGFFQWENEAKMTYEPVEAGHSDSPCSTLIRFLDFDSADDDNLLSETSDAFVKNSSLGVVVSKDFSNPKHVSNGRNNGIAPSFDLTTEYKDVISLEREELSSLAANHNTPQLKLYGKEKSALEMVKGKKCILDETALSQNTSDSVPSGTNKPERRFSTHGENMELFSGSFSLMSSEKLLFSSLSTKYVDALAAFTGSYKKLESVRGREHSLKREMLEVETEVRLYEAETSKFATSLEEVSSEMVKYQKKVAEAVRVYKQSGFAAL